MLFIILLQQLAWCSPVVFAFHFISLSSRSTADCPFFITGYLVRCKQHSSIYTANSFIKFQAPKSGAMTSYPPTFLKNQRPVFDDDEGWDSGSSSIVVGGRCADDTETRKKDTEPTSVRGVEKKNSIGMDKTKTKTYVSETDLFIPIFAMVSLAGFAGLYLYETLRLYSEGELYLPGMNN